MRAFLTMASMLAGIVLLVIGKIIKTSGKGIWTVTEWQKREKANLVRKVNSGYSTAMWQARRYYLERDYEETLKYVQKAKTADDEYCALTGASTSLAEISIVERRCQRWLKILSLPRSSKQYERAFNYEKQKDDEVAEKIYQKALVSRQEAERKDAERIERERQRERERKEREAQGKSPGFLDLLSTSIEFPNEKLKTPVNDKDAIIRDFFYDEQQGETLKLWKEQEWERKQPGDFDVLDDDVAVWSPQESGQLQQRKLKPEDSRQQVIQEFHNQLRKIMEGKVQNDQRKVEVGAFKEYAQKLLVTRFGEEEGAKLAKELEQWMFKEGYSDEEEY